ncbi:uncharacterized protein NPIL_43761 [Nephila pilipes]|uniref:DUF5641 domain-containing protein n=1 Tax=Nephila pilipes TaxID=299642 RepID=A0A8X6NZ62_NEPPI|nr:uncharacterized protein NPIL_43761 [Nephila pilipes]
MTINLTVQEIDLAEKKLLKLVQDESFIEEDNLKGLLIYVDQDGLYRLKIKIIRIDDTEDFRCPIVLPSNHELVHRLIFDHHLLHSHAGVQFDMKTVGVPDIDNLDKINLTKRWRYNQRLREQFRKRFRDEYLGLLVQRPLKRKFVRSIQINDIVLVEQDNLKRSDWLIGRVI